LAVPQLKDNPSFYFAHTGDVSSIPADPRWDHAAQRVNQQMWNISPDFTPKSNRAELHITYRCDLACINCNRLCFLPPSTPDMSLEDAHEFVRQAKELHWSPGVVIIGGEPTLHRDLFAFLPIAQELSPGRVSVWSNGYREEAKQILDRIRQEKLANVCEATIKPQGSVLHPLNDFFLAPLDFGVPWREPCHIHSRSGCGVSVDAGGYTLCPLGGAIDGVLQLRLRTGRLADLFDPAFAEDQTRAMCRVCGYQCGIDTKRIASSQVLHGALMSVSWQEAVKRIEGRS
jgi:hypothetical protein